ncbi:MAG: hypothetical protein KY439_00080 [Actinobacteria bacterium]|nr:hypothetical protein [Actinomycetota bacterium]
MGKSTARTGVGMAAALALALATPAFACVPPALILRPDAGAPGTAVTVTGSARVQKEIAFHWNGTNGPVLARVTPTNSKFSATFTVPDAVPGYYLVTAVQPGNFDNTFVVRASLQVLAPDGETPASGPRPSSSGPTLMAEPPSSSTASVLPFVLILAAIGAGGIAAVLVIGPRRADASPTAESGE